VTQIPGNDHQVVLEWPAWRGGVELLGAEDALAELRQNFETLERYATGSGKNRERLAANVLEHLILRCNKLNTPSAEGISDRRIRKTIDLLTQNLAEPLPLTELGSHCHLSPSRLSHLFGEQLGVSPRAFVERQRLERAKELLAHTTLSVAKIAEQVGFESPFYFSRRFKRHTALTPRDYRAQRKPF